MSSEITSPHSISQLEFPTPERLLPVGPQRDFPSLVERIRQALNISDVEGLYALIMGLSDKTSDLYNKYLCVHNVLSKVVKIKHSKIFLFQIRINQMGM